MVFRCLNTCPTFRLYQVTPFTVKPVLSGPHIKRTPCIKRTAASVSPNFFSLIFCKTSLHYLRQVSNVFTLKCSKQLCHALYSSLNVKKEHAVPINPCSALISDIFLFRCYKKKSRQFVQICSPPLPYGVKCSTSVTTTAMKFPPIQRVNCSRNARRRYVDIP